MNPPATYTAAQLSAATGKPVTAVQDALRRVPADGLQTIRGRPARAWSFAALPVNLQQSLEHAAEAGGYRNPESLLAHLPAVPETAPVKPATTKRPIFHLAAADHQPLGDLFHELENPDKLSPQARQFVWHDILIHFHTITAPYENAPGFATIQKRAKKSLLTFLMSALPSLSKSRAALAQIFDSKLSQWTMNGRTPDALQDFRPEKSGFFRRKDFSKDIRAIAVEALANHGNESLAHRELRQRDELTKEFCEHYEFDPRRNKSRMPAFVRDQATPVVNQALTIYQGKRQFALSGPSITRDWTDVLPGDWWSADDCTFNSYWWYEDEFGRRHITRGELLLLIDLRTGCPIDFLLIAGKYNSRHIRKLILKAHDTLGLPRKGTYFEKSVWQAIVISGQKKSVAAFRETRRGLASIGQIIGSRPDDFPIEGLGLNHPTVGLRTRNANTPRAKTIEGIFKIIQDRQRQHPGYIGTGWKDDKQKTNQDFITRVQAGREDPSNELLSMQEWIDLIRKDIEYFADDPQNGAMNPGLSPAESFYPAIQKYPLRKLTAEQRYLLSADPRTVTIKDNGITLAAGRQHYTYANDETGRRIGQKIVAWFDFENPELLVCCDMKYQDHFTVKALALPAMSATDEQFAAVNSARAAHQAPALELWGDLKHRAYSTIARKDAASEPAANFGRAAAQAKTDHQIVKIEDERKLTKLQKLARESGVAIGPHVKNPDRVAEGICLENEARARIAAKAATHE